MMLQIFSRLSRDYSEEIKESMPEVYGAVNAGHAAIAL
jgi:hypothetical protein